MKLLTIVLVIAGLAYVQTVHGQDFDPTNQILPFARELRLVGDGDYAEAIDALADTSAVVQQSIADLNIDWETVERRDPRLSPWLTGVINLNLANYLFCRALGKRMGDGRVTDTCTENWDSDALAMWCLVPTQLARAAYNGIAFDACVRGGVRELDVIQTNLWLLATALFLESEGKIETAKETYIEILSSINELSDYEHPLMVRRYESTTANLLLEDYIYYRFHRLRLMAQENARFKPDFWFDLRECLVGDEPHCPAATSGLRGLARYVVGFRLAAGDDLIDAVMRPQYWLGLDVYEHPLFWIAALGHRGDARFSIDESLRHQSELGDMVTPDVRYVLDLYTSAATFDDALPAACGTAGCRYFVAQYLYGVDRIEEGHAVIKQGADDCATTASLMCAALRFADRKIDSGGVP